MAPETRRSFVLARGVRLGGLSLVAAIALGGCVSRRECCDPCAGAPNSWPVAGIAVPDVPARPVQVVGGVAVPGAGDAARTLDLARALYDGETGAPTTLEKFLSDAESANLICFGELHGNRVGSELELSVLTALASAKTPAALAMEFFERDTQAALDAYLAGTMPEAEFVKVTRQGAAYPTSHRPLIELCKAKHIPVIAANAPRKLVTAYRVQEKPYAEYLATLSAADRAFMPAETSILEDRHKERFMEMMGPERGPRIFKSMALWDDAMADSVAVFHAAHPGTRVMLVVGVGHVTERLGTITKYLLRRPDARVRTLVLSPTEDPAVRFDESDKKLGDVVVKVHMGPTKP